MVCAWGTGIQKVQTELWILYVTQEPWEDMVVFESSEDRRACFPLSWIQDDKLTLH